MYIAKKPCHLQGKTYLIGETVPDGVIEKSRVSALVKWGMIAEVEGKAPEAKAQDIAQPVQFAPESTEEAETVNSTPKAEKALKTGKRGRKKAEA